MAAIADKEYNRKVDELITIIHHMKLRLEAKYGPSIKAKWQG